MAGDDAAEVRLLPLDEPPTKMAFEADRKIIEQLRVGFSEILEGGGEHIGWHAGLRPAE